MYLVQHDNFVKNALCSSGSRRDRPPSKRKELSSMNSITHSNWDMKSKRFAKIGEQFVPIGIVEYKKEVPRSHEILKGGL